MKKHTRREASKLMGYMVAGTVFAPSISGFAEPAMEKRRIPSSGEGLSVVGLGTWRSFDVGPQAEARKPLKEVLLGMKKMGGQCIDSSPMYGNSEQVVGALTAELGIQDSFFYATKVWTRGEKEGRQQIEASMQKMKRSQLDLLQIHNLVDWKTHLKTLRSLKEQGKIRYWGITHYTNGSHITLAEIIKRERPDFAQFNYSLKQRHAEEYLLDTAKDHGCAVIINRPFEGGSLFRLVRGKKLPDWCSEYDIHSWGQYFLKFILSEEAVTCVIPGTSKPHHLLDNMQAGYGRLPDSGLRERMPDLM